ncbi:MAG: APC family permease [Pyrinomonadaceae bacterium]
MTREIDSPTEFREEEMRVEARSAGFKKELGLSDLVLTQILFIVGLPWVGVAAKQGPSHVVLWLGAIVLFYIPSAAVVIYLNRSMPLEGGVYQWAKLGFNDLVGFLVAWNLWLMAILNTSEIGLQVTQYLTYIIGPGSEWLTSNPVFIGLANLVVISALVFVTVIGLGVGKWVHKAGGILMLLVFAAIIILPLLNFAKGTLAEYHPLRTEMPVLTSIMTLNLLGKMGFGALGGFEYVAIHAGECRDPVRTIGRSVAIAAPVIALMFILGTSSVLALVSPDKIDLIAPVPQVLSVGFGPLGLAAAIAPLAIIALLMIRLAQSSVMFGGATRLPMVAGWDNLLPAWFTKLHAKHRTPVNSILFIGAATLFLGIVGLIGVGKQEAFQLLWNASGVFYALAYLVMFAIPLVGLGLTGQRPPLWLRLAALCGFLMTLLYVGLSVVPIVKVESRSAFALKIGGLVIVTNLIGLMVYLARRWKANSRSQMNSSIVLFRPVGQAELDLIKASGFAAFPPRLPEQPIFYPVLNEAYATQIARDWNAKYNPDRVGYVTRFRVNQELLKRYEIQTVGGAQHQEYWIPAEDLEEFNRNIVGPIDVVGVFREEKTD